MIEESLEVKSLAVELRDLPRLPLERELNIDIEEGSSPTGVSGRLSGVGDVGLYNAPSKQSSRSSSGSKNVLFPSDKVLVLIESADSERWSSLRDDNGIIASAELSVMKDAKLATDPLGKREASVGDFGNVRSVSSSAR